MPLHIKDFLTVFTSFEDLDTIEKTLPSVVEETLATNSALVIHDCSVQQRDSIRGFIQAFEAQDVFVLFSSPTNQAHSRNLAIQLGIKLYAPQIIASIEDDHGYRPGFISAMTQAIATHYGQQAPNGMKFGLFSGCKTCWETFADYQSLTPEHASGHLYPNKNSNITGQGLVHYGGVNACCRCAPLRHWQSVLGNFDPDEYPVSYFQPGQMNLRNYHNGFTGMTINDGNYMFSVDRVGRGHTQTNATLRPFATGISQSQATYDAKPEDKIRAVENDAVDEPVAKADEEIISQSQLGQDNWVIEKTNAKRNGYFVEVGATNGVWLSNSYLLEKSYGWQGIVVEPNPKYADELRANRDCSIALDCISASSGKQVEFLLADQLGGMAEFAKNDLHAEKRANLSSGSITLTTLSLNDLLDTYNAPNYIDYLSVDTEGSEYEILSTFNFDRWQIAHITVEHNWSDQRKMIYDLLTARGYQRQEREWDDWYCLD